MATTYNPADKAAAIALSGGNLTVDHTGVGSNANVRCNLPILDGEHKFWSTLVNADGGSYGTLLGVANASQSLTSYVGSTTDGVGLGPDGQVLKNGLNIGTGPSWTTGDVIDRRVNRLGGVKTIGFRKNGGSWSADFDISSITGDFYPCDCVSFVGDQITSNYGATAYTYAVPVDYDSITGDTLMPQRAM